MEKIVSIDKLIEDFELEVLNSNDGIVKEIVLAEVHRPGTELTGYILDNGAKVENSIHVMGKEEISYISSIPKDVMEDNLTHYMNYDFPCVIITESKNNISDSFYTTAAIAGKLLLFTPLSTDKFIKQLRIYLQKELAPEIVLNKFTLLEIYGVGIVITGDESSRIGATIELLEKGHRFITDELLVVKRVAENVIVGENGYNQMTQDYNYFITVHGEDKINVIDYFGIGAIRKSKEIDLIIKFEKWNDSKFYDRLGIDEEKQYLLGVEIPKITLPVRKGRNLAIIMETAAINERLKKSGKNSALYFLEQTQKMIQENLKKRNGDSNMELRKYISGTELRNRYSLLVLNGEEELDNIKIFTPSIHRPSLEFSGFYEILEDGGKEKIQVIGEAELNYLDRISVDKRDKNLEKYFDYNFPIIILSGITSVPPYFIEKVKEKNKVVLYTEKNISKLIVELDEYLEIYFAPTMTMHGVLVEIFGFGVLIVGKSGIGKSETALELIHRGHRLIADDMVKFTQSPDGRVIGTAEKVPYFMEIRGLGIIDIKTLYGLGAVRNSKQLDVIIELREMKEDEYMTKAEYNEEQISVLEAKIAKVDLFISSGRNAASMVEVATMNLRAKKLGYDSNQIYMNNYDNIKKLTGHGEEARSDLGKISMGRRK
jgi:HPr kinase/phosphorylase